MRAQGEQQRQGGGQLNQARGYLSTGEKLGIFYFIGFTIVIGIRLGYTVHTEEVPATPCRAGEECADARRRPARDDEGAPPCREVGERSRGSAGTWRRLSQTRKIAENAHLTCFGVRIIQVAPRVVRRTRAWLA